MHANAGKGLTLKADPISKGFHDEVKSALAQLTLPPKLVGILATTAAPSKWYAEFTRKQCVDLGVEFVLRRVGAAAESALEGGQDAGAVEEAIIDANGDDSIDGIMVSDLISRIGAN